MRMAIDQSKSTFGDISALTERFKKFGVLGAGLIREPLTAPSLESEIVPTASSTPAPESSDLSASELAVLLRELADWHTSLRKAVTSLTEELYDCPSKLAFETIYEKVASLGYSENPAERRKLTESDLNRLSMKHQSSEEVASAAEEFMKSQSGESSQTLPSEDVEKKAADVDVNQIVKIHKFMNDTFSALVREFSAIAESTRFAYTPRLVESSAEVFVALESFRKFQLKADVIECAVGQRMSELEKNKKFAQETEKLAETMKSLYALTRPRLTRVEFLSSLKSVVDKSNILKSTALKFSKKIEVLGEPALLGCYAEFVDFTENQMSDANLQNPFEARELLDRHLRSASEDESKDLMSAWEESGLELSMFMQAVMLLQQDPSLGLPPPPPPSLFKRKNLPTSTQVVELQQALVDRLTDLKEKMEKVDHSGLRPEALVAFAQAISSAAVEDKSGFSSEDLTLAGFRHGMALSQDERFVQASMAQQSILGEIAQMAPQSEEGETNGCSVM